MRLLVALLWCRLAAPHANVTTVHLSIPFEDGARTLVWRRAAESAKEACARFAAEQGLNGDVLPDLEALVTSQTALRKVSPSLFAAPSWWRPRRPPHVPSGGHDASVAVAAADGTLLCAGGAALQRYRSSFVPTGDAKSRSTGPAARASRYSRPVRVRFSEDLRARHRRGGRRVSLPARKARGRGIRRRNVARVRPPRGPRQAGFFRVAVRVRSDRLVRRRRERRSFQRICGPAEPAGAGRALGLLAGPDVFNGREPAARGHE